MKNKKSFGILLSFVLVLAGFIFGSCEIGLGPAVDTEAPAIGITVPEVDAVIRDKFAIRGTWSDDGDIDSLTAKLKRTDGNGEPITYNGVADVNTGKWQIIVDPEKENILDGSYEVTVSIKDKGQHVTTQSRTFKIDNTPPLIVLQRPSTKSDATSVDTYGQSFTLTGQAADDNDVAHIYVNIYEDKECTKFIRTIDLPNVPPTIEQDVAKFELGVDNDYKAIYGYSEKGHGTVGRYCTINAYDGAQRYPIEGEQTDEDKLGNTTNVYYLYNDIAAAILSETKITEVYHMLDGTSLLKDASRSAAVDNVKAILEENAITQGSFSLNPDNNPIFTVSGQSPLACNGNDFTADQSHYISNGLTVVVEVSPGLDAIPLDAESLKVYFQECDLNGEPLPNAEKVYSDSTYSLSGSSYKFETPITTNIGLRIGSNYLFGVDGKDQKDNEVRPKERKYGFHLASNASAPILTVSSNKTHIKEGSGDSFVVTLGIPSNQAPFNVYRKLKTETEWTLIDTIAPVENMYEYTYTDTITPTDTIIYDYKVKDETNLDSTIAEIKCTVDGGKPNIFVESGLPNKEKTKLSSFTFKGTATDNPTQGHTTDTPSGVQKILLTIANGTDPSASNYKYRTVTVTGTSDWYYELNYSDTTPITEENGASGNLWQEVFAEEGKKYVTIKILDKVGNESDDYINKEFVYDTSNPNLTVDSSSVRNFIPTAGYDITGTAYDTLAYSLTQNLQSLEITEYKLNASNVYEKTSGTNPKPITFTTGNNWSAHVPFGTLDEGTYKYEIKAKDSVGNTVSWVKDGIKVDTIAPTVTIVNPSAYSANNTITFRGFIGEENKDTCTATLQKWNGTAWENVENGEYELNVDSSITDETQTNWSQKIYDLENAKYRLYVKAVDQARNEGEAYTTGVTVDTTFPTSTIFGTNFVKDNGDALSDTENINTQGETIYYAKEVASGAAYTISGTVTEEHFDSSKITLKVKKDDGAVETKDLTWTDKTWSYSFTSTATDGSDDGAYKYTLSVTDLANNRTDYTINVTYDTQKPTLVISEPVQNGFSGSTPITANGSIRDSGIGLKEFKYTTDNGSTWTDWTDTNGGTIERRASSWTMNFTPDSEGAIELKMKAKDYLGHEFTTEARRFSFDSNPPGLTVNDVSEYVTSGNLIISGKAYDSNLFDSISILDETNSGQITYTEASTPAISITGTKASAKTEGRAVDWTLTLPTSGTGAIENGSHKFTIIAKDDATRTTSIPTTTIVDTVKPKITLEALPSRTDTQAASFTFRGTSKDKYLNSANQEIEGSGVDKIELTIANADNSKSRTVKATGKENWYYSVVFEDETPAANETGASGNTWKEVFADEGVKKVTLKVYDKAGLSEDKFTLGEETTEVTEKTFTFDKANPVITLNQGTVLEYMPNGGFDITGTVSDSYKLAGTTEGTNCVTVEEYYKATAADSWPTAAQQTQTFNATNINNHSGAISIHVPLNNGATVDGRYKYKITVKDSMDNKGTYSTSDQGIIVDKTAPIVTITTPSSDTSHTGANAIHEQSFKFIGGFTEANEISGIYYKIIKSGIAVPAVPDGNVILDATWEGEGFTKVTAGSSTWNSFQSFTTGTTGDYCEGENYQICVYGVDKATNVSTVTTCTFDVDMSAPEIKTQVKENGGSYTDLTVDSTQIKTKTYEFRYYAKDTYGLNGSETVTVKKDGDAIEPTTSTTVPYYTIGTADDDGYKVITITVPDDGLYEYTISATDKVGKHTEVNRSIRLDRFGPTIAVQSPDLTAYQTNESVTVSGSSDDDSGTLAVYYAYGVLSAPSMPEKGIAAKTATNWTEWTAATGTTSWNFTVTGEEAQNKNLYIVAVDKNGLYENPISKVVRVDKSDPKSAFTKPNAYVSGGNLVLTGTVWDENGIKEVKVSYGTSASGSYDNSELPNINTTGTTYTAQTETSAVNKLASAKSESAKATWKSEIALSDEKYNFKVEIKDDAGKVKTETFEVTMDNTPPVVSSPVMDWGSSTVTPHNISTATLSFTVTEANVKSVSYYIDNKSSAITQNTVPSNKWSSISSNTNAYSTNLTFGDGDGNIYIKVEDMAGNVAYGTAQSYNVDTAKPDVCTIYKVNGSTETSTIMVNGRSAVPFIVKATDFNARYVNYVQKGADPAQIANVSLISVGSYTVPAATPINGTQTDAANGEWTITIPTTAFTSLNSGAKPVSVKVTDKAGNSQNFTNLFTLTLDKNAPTVGIATPKDAGDDTGIQVNETIKLEGTAKDTGGSELKSIDICYYVNATDGWQWHSRVTGDLSNWTSADIDTTALTDSTKTGGKVEDGTTVTFVAIATDTSENKNTDVNGVDKTVTVTGGLKPAADVDPSSISTAISLIVDQDTDRPTVKFTNLNEENGSYVLKYGTNSILEGTLSDDDSTESAVVETFIVSNEEITNTTGWTITPNATGDTITSTKANCGTTVFNKKTGSYTFTPAIPADGSKTVYFYLVDNGGKTYYTTHTATLNQPYQQYKTDAKVDNNAAITYLSDSTAPTIHKVYAHAYKDSTKDDEDIALGTSCIVGGTERNGIDLVVEATDANAITKIVVELDDGTEADKKTYTYTGTNITSYNEAGVTYYKAEMPKKVLSTAFPAITSTSERDYVDVTVTVYDGAGLYSNQSSLFVIDLKGPTFNISQPAENSVLYGVNENLVTGTPSATDVSKFYYYVTKAADTEIADNDWIEIGGESKISKTLVFDGDSVGTHENNVGWHCATLREWIKTAYNVTEAALTADDTNKDLYVRFKLVDNCGNIGYSSRKFVIIPNGDMPTLEVTYPLADAKLGGTIRCTGTTEIYTDEISGVYAQIDVSGAMTANWETTLAAKTNKYTVVDTGVDSGTYARGIKVSGSPYSWNFSINGSSEFNDVTNGKVAIRFFAVSTQNHKVSPVGANQTRIITIDANAPIFNSMRLVQFAADGTTITASKAYEEDMWITGQWYIYGDITDDNGVKSITYEDTSEHALVVPETNNDKSGDVTTTSPYSGYVIQGTTNHATTGTTDKAYDYTLRIPIGSSASNVFGTIRYTVKAIDATDENNSSQKIFIVNYDNKAPDFKATVSASANAAELAETGIEIKQSNAGYSFNGQFNEEGNAAGNQSGFGRILMYFTRTIGTTTNIIDVSTTKVKTTNNDNKNNYLALTGLSSETDGYWKSATANISGENTLAVTGLPTFARKGGVVKIDNVLYKITSISGTTVKVDGVLTDATGKTVYFTPALVIDNLSTESVKDGVTYTGLYSTEDDSTSLTNGDGDWLIEGVNKSGASYPWTAMINSTNILDGPITVHFVAYDAAGNMVTKSYSGNVANNAPRLAGVTIWTDYNGDKTGWRPEHTGYKDETKSSYASRVRPEIALVTGQPKERVDRSNAVTNSLEVYGGTSDAKTSYMKITDEVKFIPELVGGNGALYYSFDITGNTGASGIAAADKKGALKNDSGTAVSGTSDGDDATIASTLTLQDDDSISYIAGHTDGVITFPVDKVISKLVNTTNTASPTWFNVKIWDSTEGGTVYTDTLHCEMKVALDIKYTDDTSPNTYVNDLYWKSATDNSVYIDPSNDQLKGHVELIKDIEDFDSESEMATNYGLDDDKVSGIVVFRGTAYDNKRLSEISWTLQNSSGNDIWPDVGYIKATYSNGSWSTSGSPTGIPYCKIDISTDAKDGAYLNGDGHKVAWTLTINTNWVKNNIGGTEYPVCKDAVLTMNAKDTAGKTTSTTVNKTSTDDTVRNNPTYKMDIVPYIVDIETRLSKKDTSNPTVYSRTAKGHYPIASDEGAITLKGYNLAFEDGDVTIPAATVADMTSGAYSYKVYDPSGDNNDIMTINNMNNNDALGDFVVEAGFTESKKVTNMYNRMPNSTTNLTLTDDVYFDVWDLNQTSAASNGALKDPVMHINPSTNQIGFGFVNAVDAVSFPTSEYSYRIMEKNNKDYIGTNFAYDSNGDAHTISIGLDAQQHTSIAGRMNYMYSKWWYNSNQKNAWGQDDSNANVKNWNKTNAIALESIGIPRDIYVKGTQNNADLIDIDRFPNPKIAVANHGTTPTVYVMYYDADHDQIRFRQGIIDSGNNSRGNSNFTTFGLLNDSKSERYRHGDTQNTSIPDSGGTNYDNHGMFEASKEYYAIVTGDYYQQTNYQYINGTGTAKPNNLNDQQKNQWTNREGQKAVSTGNKGSKYYAMDVIAGTDIGSDKVIMIWYDGSAQKLMYVYRTNITETSNMDASSAGVKNGNTTYWSVPKSVFGDTTLPLQDCVIKADSKGGIHIAAYDLISADLKYAYMPNYNHLDTATNTAYTCTVDAYSQCGNCLQIDTVLDSTGNKVIPYISYLSEGMFYLPKVAFIPGGIDPTAPGNAIKDGADKDTKLFTGNWEVSLIPTTSELQKYNVCIGVWRDADGKITTPTKGTDAATGTTDRKRYANGNTNLVLGYSHKLNGIGYMETAMYKGVPTY